MRVRKKSSILKKAVLLLALAGLLGNGVFAETTFAGIRGGRAGTDADPR